MSSASNARLLKAAADCLSQGKPNTYGAQVRSSGSSSEFSEFDHFRSKSPLPFPVKPLLVKPLPIGYFHVPLTWFSIHFCACSIHFCSSTHVCAVRFIFRTVRLMLVQLDLFLCVSLYLYVVRFIFVRFDSFVYGSIYFCAGSIQFLRGSIHFLLF